MSTPPNALDHLAERGADGVVGDVAGERPGVGADRLGLLGRGLEVHVEQRDLGAGGGERPGGGGADRAGGAGDDGDLAGQRLVRLLAELGLFDRPVFDVEHVGFGDRLEAADRLGVGDGRDRGLGEIGGDAGVLGGAAESVEAEPRHQHDAGQGIDHFLVAARRARCGGRNTACSCRCRRRPRREPRA